MEYDIYKPSSKNNVYIFIEVGGVLENKVPENILHGYGDVAFVKTISFDDKSPLISAHPKEVIESIKNNGYFIQGAAVTTKVDNVSEAGAAIGSGILAASLGFGPLGAIVAAVAGYALANASKNEDGGSNDADS